MNKQEDVTAKKDAVAICGVISILLIGSLFMLSEISFTTRIICTLSIVLSLIIGNMGKERKIGFGPAFFISLFLSPVVGIIITANSPRFEDEEYRERILRIAASGKQPANVADELFKLNELRKEGVLSEEEFAAQKQKLLGD